MNFRELLDRAIEKTESDIATLKAARKILAAESASRRRADRVTVFSKIRRFFEQRNNEPATIKQIVAGTTAAKDSIRQTIYKDRPIEFSRDGKKGGGRETKFWLAAEDTSCPSK